MDFHAITRHGVFLIHSDDMSQQARKTIAQIDAERAEFIKSGKTPIPTGRCVYCDYPVAPKILFCTNDYVKDFAAEKAALDVDPGPNVAR